MALKNPNMALVQRIREAGAAGITRNDIKLQATQKTATVDEQLGILRRAGLVIEQPSKVGQAKGGCLFWTPENVPAVMPEYAPKRRPPIMQDRPACQRTLDFVKAAGSAGVKRSQIAEALGVSEVTASDKLQRLVKRGLIEARRHGVGVSHAMRVYYGAGLMPAEVPEVIPKAKPRTHQAIRAPQGPAIIPAGVKVQVCPAFDGDRWRVTAPAVSRLDPDDCRPWARACV